MKLLNLIYLLSILNSCISNQTTIEQNNVKPKMLTEKELEYINQLEIKGCNKIEIVSPAIGDDSPGWSIYQIILFSKINQTENNLDSIKSINKEIAKELYTNVIEDSILYDLGKISVSLNVKNKIENGSNIEIYETYNKKQLEEEFKFKVIKKDDGTFERVKFR